MAPVQPVPHFGEPDVPPAVSGENLERLVRTTPTVWLLSTLAACILYLQFIQTPQSGVMLIWVLVSCTVSSLRVATSLWRRRTTTTSGWWRGSTLLHAVLWGVLSVLLWEPGSVTAESVLHTTMATIAMGGAVRMPGLPRLADAHVALVLGPLVLRDLATGQSEHWLMALLIFLIGMYAVISRRNQTLALVEIHEQRTRNAELIEALQRENERSEAARRAAEEAIAARTRFFAAANHDLRQPLHAMGLLSQALLEQGQQAVVSEVASHLVECVDGMAQVVDDLLEITRMDAGSMEPQCSVFMLDELLHECSRPHGASAHAKGLQLRTEVAPVAVRCDRAMLGRVVSNLLSNAIRYTRVGTVTMRTQVAGEQVLLQVEDTGIGIAAAQQLRIFEEFYQVGNPARDRRLGLGLGLATVKRLSDLLGLDVAVQSKPGLGSVFTLRLPLAATPTPPNAAAALVADAPMPGMRRVLVVEDDADSRHALLGLLRSWGCEALGAAGLTDSLALLDAGFAPEALVVDLRLADGANGIDAVQALRSALQRDALPAVLVTGDVGSAHMRSAQAAGLPVMAKPVKPAQLRAFLGQAFAKA